MMPNTLDFAKVEALRKHMLLTTANMAELLGVTRTTYYAWLKGKPIRRNNEQKAKAMLKKLLAVMTDYGWPMPEIIAANQKQRMERLREILDK